MDKRHKGGLHRSEEKLRKTAGSPCPDLTRDKGVALYATISLPKWVTMRAAVECIYESVQFILEALVGSLAVLAAEGGFLLEDRNFEPLRKPSLPRSQSRKCDGGVRDGTQVLRRSVHL